MGVPLTKQRGVCLTGKNGVKKYYPLMPYRPFPVEKTKIPGELICQFKAYPVVQDASLSDGLYWWCDAEFMPYNDSTLFTCSGAYQIRLNHPWIDDKHVPAGRLCRFDFDRPKLRCEVFSGTHTVSLPKVQFHPDSFHVGYLGCREVKLVGLENIGFHSKARDLTFRTYKYFDISPDGEWYAVLARNQLLDYELLLFSSRCVTTCEATVNLRKLNQEFKGLRSYNEQVECKWSQDSNYIGVAISTGTFLVLKRVGLSLVADIFQDIVPDSVISLASTFDFDPLYGHKYLAVGSIDRYMCVIDIPKSKVINQSDVCSDSSIDALKYTPDGRFIGIGMRDFVIHLYNPSTWSVTFSIDMKESCSGIPNSPSGPYPAIIRLNFSMSGEQAVVSTHDGYVRIWQLPKVFDLQSICKLKILSLVPIGKVKLLPLPNIIIDYLLNMPSSTDEKFETASLHSLRISIDNGDDNRGCLEEQHGRQPYKHFVSRDKPALFGFRNIKQDLLKLKSVKLL